MPADIWLCIFLVACGAGSWFVMRRLYWGKGLFLWLAVLGLPTGLHAQIVPGSSVTCEVKWWYGSDVGGQYWTYSSGSTGMAAGGGVLSKSVGPWSVGDVLNDFGYGYIGGLYGGSYSGPTSGSISSDPWVGYVQPYYPETGNVAYHSMDVTTQLVQQSDGSYSGSFLVGHKPTVTSVTSGSGLGSASYADVTTITVEYVPGNNYVEISSGTFDDKVYFTGYGQSNTDQFFESADAVGSSPSPAVSVTARTDLWPCDVGWRLVTVWAGGTNWSTSVGYIHLSSNTVGPTTAPSTQVSAAATQPDDYSQAQSFLYSPTTKPSGGFDDSTMLGYATNHAPTVPFLQGSAQAFSVPNNASDAWAYVCALSPWDISNNYHFMLNASLGEFDAVVHFFSVIDELNTGTSVYSAGSPSFDLAFVVFFTVVRSVMDVVLVWSVMKQCWRSLLSSMGMGHQSVAEAAPPLDMFGEDAV